MKRSLLCVFLIVAGACSTTGAPTRGPAGWPEGRYLLEASVTYGNGGGTQVDRHTAELQIGHDGTMTLDSSSGLCQDPTEMDAASDRSLGRKTFLCGELRFELRPGGGGVFGQLVTTVNVQELVSRCVEYKMDATGNRVCARTEEHLESRSELKRVPLQSRPLP